jgi:hypothetical protein
MVVGHNFGGKHFAPKITVFFWFEGKYDLECDWSSYIGVHLGE